MRGVQDALARWIADHPDEEWVVGACYDPALLPGGVGDARWLDEVTSDRPIVLTASDGHVMWVNTRAMEIAGIDATTPEPAGGQIERRDDGSPIGALREFGALELMERVMPPTPLEKRLAGFDVALDELRRLGIVWVQDASVTPELLETYAARVRTRQLTCRFNLAFRAEPGRWDGQRTGFLEGRDAFGPGSITARTIKFFADGVIEAGTAALLDPYVDAPDTFGLPNWTLDELTEAVSTFDADGFQVHIHAIGDAGVRTALDAIEHASNRDGMRDRRAVIAHTQLVHPDDIPRFRELDVIANFEPLWCQLDPSMVELTIPRLGDGRAALQYPIGTLVRSGTHVSFGSDWSVSSLDPVEGIAVAATRQDAEGQPSEGWTPDERITIFEALSAYTAGTAYQAFDDDRSTLEPGSPADLVVLNTDITAIEPSELWATDVELTMLEGRVVYR